MVISLLALHVSHQSGSSPVSDLSLVSPDVKSVPYSGHLLCFSLSFFNSVLFFFFFGVRGLSLLAVFQTLAHPGCVFLCFLVFSGFFDLPFELALNSRLIFFREYPQGFPNPCE